MGARTLEGAVAALAPAGKQCVASASLPKDDAAISSYVLDKVRCDAACQLPVCIHTYMHTCPCLCLWHCRAWPRPNRGACLGLAGSARFRIEHGHAAFWLCRQLADVLVCACICMGGDAQLVSRYAAQFKVDARRLQQEMEGAYDEEFGKTFNELLDKYLTDFTQEVRVTPFAPSLHSGSLVESVLRSYLRACVRACFVHHLLRAWP